MRRFSEKSTDNFQNISSCQSSATLQVPVRLETFRSLRRSIHLIPVIALLVLALSGAVLGGAIKSGIITNSGTPSGPNTATGLVQTNGISPIPGKAFLVSTINVGSLSPPSQRESSSHIQPAMFGSKTSSTSSPSLKGPVPLANTSSTVSIINGFDGLGQAISGQAVPPDVQVAAGPNHLVEMVSLAGEVFTKQGVPVTEFSLYSFFNTASPKALSDPKILYDAQSGRWFASILIGLDAGFFRGNATLAVSTSNDPTGNWNLYKLIIGDFLPDQPLLGVSDDKVVVSVNNYPRLDSGGFFEGAQYFVLNKGQLLAGVSSVDYDSIGPDKTLESVYPVQSLSTTTTHYLVSVGAGDIRSTSTKVKLFSITGILPITVTVTNSSLTVATISNPPNAVEAGTNELIQTDDFRIQSAAWFQGSLWYSLNDGCIPTGDTQVRSCVRLTKLNTTTPSVVQDFDLGTNGQYYYYPALSIDNTGGMDLVYGFSSSTLYPSLAVTGQVAGAKAGSLASSVVLVQGTAPDTGGIYYFSSVTRYGVFFGASLDPSNSR